MKSRIRSSLGVAAVAALACGSVQGAGEVTIMEGNEGQYDIRMGGRLFTTLHLKGQAKPILYPIIGPHGVRMTRDYPMKEGTPGEAKDHPHQQSLWFTHGDVNGVSFWHLGQDAGRIETTEVESMGQEEGKAFIRFQNKWVDPAGKVLCTDRQMITFHGPAQDGGVETSMIDYEITLHASEGEVVFGDTKEGTMGIRTHPGLRIDKGAEAVNSEGVRGREIWGKRAKWVDYSATLGDHKVGVAILDHPGNPRHPTWWHAREYGLVAANPFGIHDFERKPAGTGNFSIPKGQSVTFRYRFIFHGSDAETAGIAERFKAFAKP